MKILLKQILDFLFLALNSKKNINIFQKINQDTNLKKNNNFISAFYYGVLRNVFLLDYILGNKIKKYKYFNLYLKNILRCVCFHSFFSEKPDNRVINNLVEIAKKRNYKFGRLTKGVSGNIIKNKAAILAEIEQKDILERYCLLYSFPSWLAEIIIADYGIDKGLKIIKDYYNKPKVYISVLNKEILEKFIFFLKEKCKIFNIKIENSTIEIEKKSLAVLLASEFRLNKDYIFQDYTSAFLSLRIKEYLSDYNLELCAGRGTKYLFYYEKNKKYFLSDISENKILFLQNQIKREDTLFLVSDAKNIKLKRRFKCIIIDSPCTNFGVIKRKPEIKSKDESLIDKMSRLQKEIVRNGLELLENKGYLIYSVCSILKKETKDIKEFILKTDKNFKIIEEKLFYGFENQSDGFYYLIGQKNEI